MLSAYCTTCGTRRAEGAEYCSRCEAAFKDERKVRPAEGPPGYGTGWFVGATLVLAAVVTGVILGGNWWVGRSLTAPESIVYGQRLTPDGYVTVGPTQPPAETPSEASTPAPTEDETSTDVPLEPTTPSVPTVGNELITAAPDAAQNPAAADVVQLLTAYFTAINNHDYDSYQAQLTRAARTSMTRKQFMDGYRSTVDSQITLQSLGTGTDGRLLAEVSFVSAQNAEDGPDGQTCTQWTVGKFLEGQGTSLRIGKALSGHSSHQAC